MEMIYLLTEKAFWLQTDKKIRRMQTDKNIKKHLSELLSWILEKWLTGTKYKETIFALISSLIQ
jgi:hypothetical protein